MRQWSRASAVLIIVFAVAAFHTAVADERVITVRILPKVKLQTLRALAAATVPEEITLRLGDTLRSVVEREYGAVSEETAQKLMQLVREFNPDRDLDGPLSSDTSLILPSGPRWSTRVVQRIPFGSTVSQEAEEAMGTANELGAVKAANQSIPDLDKVAANTEVALPYATYFVSFRVRPERVAELDLIIQALLKDPAMQDPEATTDLWLVANWEFTAGSSCPALPPMTKYPPALDADALNLGVPEKRRAVLAVIDSGLAAREKFALWQNATEANGRDGEDDDKNHFVDDKFGCNIVAKGGFPDDTSHDPKYTSHGTHVAALATGRLMAPSVVKEFDRRVALLPLRIADDRGTILPQAVSDAVIYAARAGATVVNMSFAGAFSTTVEFCVEKTPEVLFVVAAGNGARGIGFNVDEVELYPARHARQFTNLLSVGAHDAEGKRACFSNYGATTIDVAAPGMFMASITRSGITAQLNGTSQAAAYVSFIAALLAAHGLPPAEVRSRIICTVDIDDQLRTEFFSGGRVNVRRAMHFDKDLVEDEQGNIFEGRIVAPAALQVAGISRPFNTIGRVRRGFDADGDRVTVIENGKPVHIPAVLPTDGVTITLERGGELVEIQLKTVTDIIPASSRRFP